MLRSFHYAAAVSLRERGIGADDDALAAADLWENRARGSFVDGYFGADGVDEILPGQDARELLLDGFELDKAVYEVAYELGFRPTWVNIPTSAIERILGEGQ